MFYLIYLNIIDIIYINLMYGSDKMIDLEQNKLLLRDLKEKLEKIGVSL